MHLYPALSDTQLLQLFKSGDESAYEEIYRRYWSLIFIAGMKVLSDEDEVKDIVQDVFLSLWTNISTIQINNSLNVYLYSAVRYKMLDRIRHNKVKGNYLLSLHDYSEAAHHLTDGKVIEKELITAIENAIALLPDKMRAVYELSRNEQLSHKEIARILNISDKTVKKQINNALKLLKIELVDVIILLIILNS